MRILPIVHSRVLLTAALPATLVTLAGCGGADPLPRLVLGTTHTIEDSGVLGVLDSAFGREFADSYQLVSIVAGSGEILTMARRGDVDVVLSHSPDEEAALVAAGRVESRAPVMHNDFLLLGPVAHPPAVAGGSAADMLHHIAATGALFVSRGDGSGTHRRELELWAQAKIAPEWPGYIEAGAGMADALRVASQRGAYILADRATFEMLRPELRLAVVHEDADLLRNQYSVLVIADARNAAGARRFAAWIRSPALQRIIGEYGVDRTGRALFMPDAAEGSADRPERD